MAPVDLSPGAVVTFLAGLVTLLLVALVVGVVGLWALR